MKNAHFNHILGLINIFDHYGKCAIWCTGECKEKMSQKLSMNLRVMRKRGILVLF